MDFPINKTKKAFNCATRKDTQYNYIYIYISWLCKKTFSIIILLLHPKNWFLISCFLFVKSWSQILSADDVLSRKTSWKFKERSTSTNFTVYTTSKGLLILINHLPDNLDSLDSTNSTDSASSALTIPWKKSATSSFQRLILVDDFLSQIKIR